MGLDPFVCPLLIRPHQTRVARHIGGEDCGKAADRRHVAAGGQSALNQVYPETGGGPSVAIAK